MALPFYNVIVKVESKRFVKYRKVTRFQSMYRYLDRTFPKWTWGNVYQGRKQIGSFTKNNRPFRF